MLPAAAESQIAAAQHRREAERDKTGDENRDRDSHREFVQQPSDNSAHEEHGNEHRHQRNGHGDDGEADLFRSEQRGFHPRLSHFHVAHDIFEHDDGVVDNEAHGKSESHQRKIVQAITQQVHDGERAHD